MMSDLDELIRDARKELRRASGEPLTANEVEQDRRKAEIADLQKQLLPKLGSRIYLALLGTEVWTPKGASVVLNAPDGKVFHLRKAPDKGVFLLLVVKGDGEREISRIEGSDQLFGSRVLVAIADNSTISPPAVSIGRPIFSNTTPSE